MEFSIPKTRNTPEISVQEGKISFSGKSIPEDAFAFYEPIIRTIEAYLEHPQSHTAISLNIEYINSSSKKILTSILKTFEKSYLLGNQMEIEWMYEADDESIIDLGHDLRSIIHIPFRFIEISM